MREHPQIDAVLMADPCENDRFSLQVAKAMPAGAILIHCQETLDTNPAFYTYLKNNFQANPMVSAALNQAHLVFNGLQDNWEVAVKRSN